MKKESINIEFKGFTLMDITISKLDITNQLIIKKNGAYVGNIQLEHYYLKYAGVSHSNNKFYTVEKRCK